MGKGVVAVVVGTITLLLGSTSVFAEIQDSINSIWGLKPKPKKGWLKMIQNRFLSFSVIIGLGFLLLVSLGITAVMDGISTRLKSIFSRCNRNDILCSKPGDHLWSRCFNFWRNL